MEIIYYDTATVARLSSYSSATLRNYMHLAKLSPRERRKRGLQNPPEGMPLPKKDEANGRLRWPAPAIDAWVAKRIQDGVQGQ